MVVLERGNAVDLALHLGAASMRPVGASSRLNGCEHATNP